VDGSELARTFFTFAALVGAIERRARQDIPARLAVSRVHLYNHAMRQGPHKLENPALSWMIYPFACALVVIGAKCWMIGRYGSPTPDWDQWDDVGANLYPRFLSGILQFSDLIAPHNEHRVLVTRLWSLLLLELEGYWDPILQMLANTLLLGVVVALLVAAFRPILDRASWLAFAAFTAVMFSLPLSWENTLAGFNSQWYFMLFFSMSGLLAVTAAAAFTPRWWIGTSLLLVSCFSMAGGVLTMAAAFAICTVQFFVKRRSSARELLALAILAAVTVAMLRDTLGLANNAPLKPHSVGQFFGALMEIASWPLTSGQPVAVLIVCAIFIYGPALLASLYVIGLRPPLTDRGWLLVGLAGWAAMQMAAIAYGRAGSAVASRYFDVFVVGLAVNCACLLYLLLASQYALQRRRLAAGAIALWLVPVLASAIVKSVKDSRPQMSYRHLSDRAQTESLQAYLDTGNISALESNKSHPYILYPDASRLAAIVSQPVIRAILPPALIGEASAARAQQRGLAWVTGSAVQAIKRYMLRWGALLMPAGIMFFLLGLAVQWRSSVMQLSTRRPPPQ
jgi:hypothetical protein